MILALGTVTLDTVDTPSANVIDAPGGSALYFAAAASHLAKVRPVGVLGADYPATALTSLERLGVDLTGLRTSDLPSFRWHADYDEEGSRTTVSSDRTILDAFDPTLTTEEAAAPWVFLGSIDPRIQQRVMDQAKAPLGVALDSMSHWIGDRKVEMRTLVARATVYFGSEDEVRALGGSEDVDAAAHALLDQGPAVVVVKRGRRGARVITGEVSLEAPAESTVAVDPTGAGDAFAGGFMATLVEEGWTSENAGGPQPQGPLERALSAGIRAGARASSAFSWEGLLR